MAGSVRRLAVTVGAILIVPVVIGGLWMWLLAQSNMLEAALARKFPWPVACSLRGCVTTTMWDRHLQTRVTFAQANDQAPPSATEALTTLVRQHLVEQAFLRVPVTQEDAVRYRKEVLNATDEATVQLAVGLSLTDYDRLVILPLLQQEALRRERRVESLDELFMLLARERPVAVLAWPLRWDKDMAQVVAK